MALERSFVDSLIFGQSRYIDPLRSRKDLISSKEHKVLFSNIETISAIMKTICLGRKHENLNNVLISYRKELPNFIEAYDNYFSLLKTAETIVVDKVKFESK